MYILPIPRLLWLSLFDMITYSASLALPINGCKGCFTRSRGLFTINLCDEMPETYPGEQYKTRDGTNIENRRHKSCVVRPFPTSERQQSRRQLTTRQNKLRGRWPRAKRIPFTRWGNIFPNLGCCLLSLTDFRRWLDMLRSSGRTGF